MPSRLLETLPPRTRHYLLAVQARARGIVVFLLVVAAVATVVAMLLPQWWAAQATLLPPQEPSEGFGLMSSLVESSTLNRIGLFTTQTPSDVFAEILNSRTLREDLIRTFDLQQRYKAKKMDIALAKLKKHVSVAVDKSGLILVRVEDRDPQRAADMANHLVASLDRFNRETFSTRAKRVRIFLEGRLDEVSKRMTEADSTLADYERKNKIVASAEGAAVSGIANIMAQRYDLEIRRSYIASYSRPDSPALRQIDAEIAAYEGQLARMPSLRQKGARLALDAELQRRLFSILSAQYEDARVQEMRDTPTVTLLDPAERPELRARPKRAVLVGASVVVAALLALGWVWVGTRGEAAV